VYGDLEFYNSRSVDFLGGSPMPLSQSWRAFYKSIRFRLVCLALALAVPIGVAVELLAWTSYRNTQADIDQRMRDTSLTLSLVMDRELEGIQEALFMLTSMQPIASGDFDCLRDQCKAILSLYPQADIILTDETGQQIMNSFAPPGQPLPKRSIPDRVRAVFETGKPSISEVYRGAITKRLLVSVDVPVTMEGRVKYDLGLTLPVETLLRVLRLPELPLHWTATILDNKDVIIARTGEPAGVVGFPAEMPVLFERRKHDSMGSLQAKGLAGVQVQVGYCQSKVSGWTVVVSVPRSSLLADLYRQLALGLIATLVMIALGAWIAQRHGQAIIRSFTSLSTAAKTLGRGESVELGPQDFAEASSTADSLNEASLLLRRREEELRTSKEEAATKAHLLEAVLTSMADGLIILDTHRQVTRLNPAARRTFPWLVEGAILDTTMPPEGVSMARADGSPLSMEDVPGLRALAGETVIGEEFRITHPVHGEVLILVSAAPLTTLDGAVVGAVVSFRDISNWRRVETKLMETQEMLRAAIASTTDGVVVVNANGDFIIMNDAAAAYHRFPSLDVCPRKLSEYRALLEVYTEDGKLVPPDERVVSRALRGEVVANEVFQLRRRDTGERWFGSYSFSPMFGPEGSIIGGVFVVRDVTEAKRREEQRAEVERIIRHDIKSPLNGLYGLAQLAFDSVQDPELREQLPKVVRNVRNVITLVDSQEKILRMERGDYQVKAEAFSCAEVLASVEQTLQVLLEGKDVRLTVQSGTESIFGEESLVECMLCNLIKNAVEAAPNGSAVTVDRTRGDGWDRLTIHNLGVVPKEIREHFFEKYSTSGKVSGLGFGTYSAWLIANAHGGRIEMTTSEADGTTVTVFLPNSA
jgi:PAS domain S-box-containing protein